MTTKSSNAQRANTFQSSTSMSSSSACSTTTDSGSIDSSSQQPQGTCSQTQERTMGLTSAILMIIGTLIGTGIFASPGPLFDSVHCTQTSFMIWAFAGLICTIGAFSYAELGTMFPESGGDFQYLARAYSKKVALVFGWSFITILNPVGTAGIAGVLGRYSVDVIAYLKTGSSTGLGGAGASTAPGWQQHINSTFAAVSVLDETGFDVPQIHSPFSPGTPSFESFPNEPLRREQTGAVLLTTPHPFGDEVMRSWAIRAFAIGAILLMGAINVFFKEGGKYASNILAIFKIGGMCMLIVIGSMQAVKNHAQSEALSIPIRETSHDVLDYVSALCFAFFAYNGFNNINLGLGELRDPERNLKRAVWIAMPFVTILFLLANFAFFSILSSHDLRHVHSLSLHAGHTVLGLPGGFLMAGTVIASALGSINANLWAGSRLLVIMAKDNAIIPLPVAKVWQRTGTQAMALIILIAQASFHAMLSLDFKTFSKIFSAVGWSWYGLSILGLLWLRKKKPSYPRPVKVFWPLAAGFVSVAFFLVFGSLTLAFMGPSRRQSGRNHGGEGAGRYTPAIMFGMAILFMTGVIPAYYLTQWYNRRCASNQGPTAEAGQGRNGDCGTAENDDEKERRHSNASSITLVGESKKKKKRHMGIAGSTRGSTIDRPGPSRANSFQDATCSHDDIDEDEEEVARIHALHGARRNSLDNAELGSGLGGGFRSTYLSPSGALSTLPSMSCETLDSPYEPHHLDIPRKLSSRSSQSTLGTQYDYAYEKNPDDNEQESVVCAQQQQPQDHVAIEGLEVLPRSVYLDIPIIIDSASPTTPTAPSPLTSRLPFLNGQHSNNTDNGMGEAMIHPFELSSSNNNDNNNNSTANNSSTPSSGEKH